MRAMEMQSGLHHAIDELGVTGCMPDRRALADEATDSSRLLPDAFISLNPREEE